MSPCPAGVHVPPLPVQAPALAVAALLSLFAIGCANPRPPLPPSLHIPAPASALQAQRIDQRVVLTWNTPDKSSDGLPLRGATTAVVCRSIIPFAATSPEQHPAPRLPHPPSCDSVVRLAVAPGPGQASDPLPSALLADPPQLLAYRVELFNPQGRSAKPSPPAFAAAGAAPSSPGTLQVAPTRQGAVVQWVPSPAATSETTTELTRELARSPQGAAPQGQSIPSAQPESAPASAAPPRKSRPLAIMPAARQKDPAAPVLLRSRGATGFVSGADPGGLLDPGVAPHATYIYTAQRIRTVQLQGHSLEIRSALSPPVTFTNQDIFPPRPPSGLVSIPSAPLAAPASIDLSWEPGPEPDLLGYNIYRADAPSGPFRRLNPDPIPGISFRDLSAELAHTYIYQVTALDQSHNESPPSAPVQDSLRRP